MRLLIKYGFMFVSLVLVQVLVLNQVQLGGFINPYIYILFILLLPLNTPGFLSLLLAFASGLTIDIFMNTLGVHAAATVLLAFIRPAVIAAISNREENKSEYPGLLQNKFSWFLYYVSIMVFIHHIVLFYLEVFTFSGFFKTLFFAVVSALCSIFVIVLSQFLVFRK